MTEADQTAYPRRRARDLFRKAYRAQLDGNLDDAIRLYSESIRSHPTAEAFTFLGWTHSFRKDFKTAIRYCLRAIDIDVHLGTPYNDIGAYLIEQNRWKEAEPWLRAATRARRYNSYHLPYFNLGRLSERRFDWDEAEQHYLTATRLAPNFKPAVRALGLLRARSN